MSNTTSEINQLFETVVRGGYCIGCGACSAVPDSPIKIEMDKFGCYQATLTNNESTDKVFDSEPAVLAVCPFSDTSTNEDILAKNLYGTNDDANHDSQLGYYIVNYAGYVKEGRFRETGSSGGMGKWILHHLFMEDYVDTIIQVRQAEEPGRFIYEYQVVHSAEDITKGSKSVYYPVEMSGILDYIKKNKGRYVIVGVPCFIKAIRLLSAQYPIYQEKIKFCIGLICGHFKSNRYADMLAWQRRIAPGDLSYIDFRKKIPGRKANEKGVELIGVNEKNENISSTGIVQEFFGTDYNLGFFKYKACDFCDDVVAETADLTIGDAWLPEYLNDGGGTNVVIVRNGELGKLMKKAIDEGKLHMKILSPELAVKSQAAGYRHRHEGLSYRLYKAGQQNLWHPPKRIKPGFEHILQERIDVYKMRTILAEASHLLFHAAVEKNDYNFFESKMQMLINNNSPAYVPPPPVNEGFLKSFKKKIHKNIHSLLLHTGLLSTAKNIKKLFAQ